MYFQAGDGHRVRRCGLAALAIGGDARAGASTLPARDAAPRAAQQRFERERAACAGITEMLEITR